VYVEVLCQIRGIGRYIAMLVIAEVGDISRFPSARHLCAWAGLTPTVRSSDGKARLAHITGQGSPALRWALIEAAQHSARGSGPLRNAYERISKRSSCVVNGLHAPTGASGGRELDEPTSTARHSGPPSAAESMTGPLPPAFRPSPYPGRPTTRGP